jgi:hypothetical protein
LLVLLGISVVLGVVMLRVLLHYHIWIMVLVGRKMRLILLRHLKVARLLQKLSCAVTSSGTVNSL